MLGVQWIAPLDPVDSVGADPHYRPHTFSPLGGYKQPVFPMIHTPTTTTILFFQ